MHLIGLPLYLVIILLGPHFVPAMAQNTTEDLSEFITANHILDYHGIVNGFGHISLRNPDDPSTFFMTGSLPPALVRGLDDIGLYTVANATPISGSTGNANTPYQERFIHSSILRLYPGVQSVIHSHSIALISRANSEVPLRPMFNLAAFLGDTVPVFDPEDIYQPGEQHLLLVNKPYIGDALASLFSGGAGNGTTETPPRTVVLQRAHGFTVWGTSVQQAVFRAIYTQYNAQIQKEAEEIVENEGGPGAEYLSPSEIVDSQELDNGAWVKEWPLWEAQVEVDPLYQNNL